MVSESPPLKVRGLPYTSCCSARPCSSRHFARCQFTPSVPAHPAAQWNPSASIPHRLAFAVRTQLESSGLARGMGSVGCIKRCQDAAANKLPGHVGGTPMHTCCQGCGVLDAGEEAREERP